MRKQLDSLPISGYNKTDILDIRNIVRSIKFSDFLANVQPHTVAVDDVPYPFFRRLPVLFYACKVIQTIAKTAT